MSEPSEYRGAGRWPGDGWARIMCQRVSRMPAPSVSGVRA